MGEERHDNISSGHTNPGPDLATVADLSPPRGHPFLIVGVGASAGGLEAFSQLLGAIPEHVGLAIVLVQHLDPGHDSLLAQILAPTSKMPVETVYDGIRIQPDRVYVIPPNASMELQDGCLRLAVRQPGLHLPIDIFFRSLARVQGSRAIGVVLSGNASDGSAGVRAIKAECGLTFAQDEESASFCSMPRNAVATGAVDYVLRPREIGAELARLSHHPFVIPPISGVAESEALPQGDGDLKRILAMLQIATKVDFSQYKQTTIQRRIGRRMVVLRIDTLAQYADYVQQRPNELGELYKELLISVTSFFRDPDTFEALAQQLKIAFAQGHRHQHSLRVWVPGCASGEEVYSLAIRLHEFIEKEQLMSTLQLFGTDISEPSLERAREGIYTDAVKENVSERRLRRFFRKRDGGYQITKMIRELCVFARHDITKDPPFSKMDLISCRNVLIYLGPKAQRKVLPAFHYALAPAGLLLLGSSETAGAAAELFTTLDKTHHIYGRRSAVPIRLALDFTYRRDADESAFHATQQNAVAGNDLQKKLDRVIQDRYSPDGVVVDTDLQILQFKGYTAPYLDPSPGEASLNLLRMARKGLVMPLRRVIQRAAESGVVARDDGATVEVNGQQEQVALEVTPLTTGEGADRYFLIVFNRNSQSIGRPPELASARTPIEEEAQNLQKELMDTRDYLRTMQTEYEARAEELRAANEEARSANEELQSTNEELGTTKEELQSANEELTTVNEELHHRNRELAATNGDLRNFLSAVSVAVVIVDQDLRIRRFNRSAEKLLDLGPTDIGRSIGHLQGQIATPNLEAQVRKVIETLGATTEEVQDINGSWYSIGVLPYRTLDERIEGAVITFQDIDPLKRGLAASEEAREYAESLIETVREPLIVLDADLRVQRATAAFYETFLVSREETEGRFLYDLGNGQWDNPRLRELLGAALFKAEPFHDFEIDLDFQHIGRRIVRLNARRIPRRDPKQRIVLLAIEDVTERKAIAEIRFQRLFETAKDGIIVIDADDATIRDVNAFLLELTGYKREDLVGKSLADAARRLSLPELESITTATRVDEVVRYEDVSLTKKSGAKVSIEAIANRYMVGSQPVIQVNVRDISARRQSEKALRSSEERFRMVIESVRDYAIFQLDQHGCIVTWNSGAERLLGWKEHEILGQNGRIVFTPEDVANQIPEKELETAARVGRADDERWHLRKDGSRFFASGVLTRASDDVFAFTKVMQDVTTRKQQEHQLRVSLEEKSILVREVHHRVKNNLQMIVSLLSMQSGHANDPHVLSAFEETEARVRAIAHIHEQLYTTEDLTTVEVGEYVGSLARELVAINAKVPNGVELSIDTEKIFMHIEKAIPVGLIANELILNSLKHAYHSGTGKLRVSFRRKHQLGVELIELMVEDTGPGLPDGFDVSRVTSMGYQLISLLARQLRGNLTFRLGPGAGVCVTFPMPSTR